MRLLICAGGTGGGVYPALAVLQTIENEAKGKFRDDRHPEGVLEPDVQRIESSILWVGSVGGMEVDLIKRAGVPFEAIPAAGVHGVGMGAMPKNLVQLAQGYRQAGRILRSFCPEVLFFTGGYVAVPMALAGRKIPSLLYVPDIEPGLALKTIAHYADCIAVTAEESRAYFPHHPGVHVSGYPTRASLKSWNVEETRQALGLKPDLFTLLAFGGSKGARSINRALLAVLPELLEEMQVIHISGELDWPEVEAARAALAKKSAQITSLVDRYRPFAYLHDEMGAALAAADVVISRAGASTIGELPIFGLPAILVPYPHAWRYQQVNAQYLAQRGAALIIEDENLPNELLATVRHLMRDQTRREQMSQAMRSLACPTAAKKISQLLYNLAIKPGQERVEL